MNPTIDELKRRIAQLEDEQRRGHAARPSRRLVGSIVAFVLALAAAGYATFGNLPAWRTAPAADPIAAQGHDDAQYEAMALRLEARLRAQPDDAAGWAMLARTWFALQRFDRAVPAFERAARLSPDDAGLYADWADAAAMVNGGRLDGEPERLVGRALELDPDHVKALSLAGTLAFRRGDDAAALRHWERALRAAPARGEAAERLRAVVDEARARAGAPRPRAAVNAVR